MRPRGNGSSLSKPQVLGSTLDLNPVSPNSKASILLLSFTPAQILPFSAPSTFTTTCGAVWDPDVTATELFPSSPALTNL